MGAWPAGILGADGRAVLRLRRLRRADHSGDANALFESDGAGGYTGRWVVVHRGDRCDPPGGPFRLWGWEALWKQLVNLLHNSGYDLEEVWGRVRRLLEAERRAEEANE